jgi:hypothetical protein
MPTDPITFTLTDADGKTHTYEVIPHPPTEGSRIMWSLVGLGAEPLGRLIKGLFAAGEIKNLRAALDASDGVGKLLAAIDPAELAGDIRRSLATVALDKLGRDILSRTSRDGRNLANDLHFDAAYTRNYSELLRSLWEVVKANRFLSLPGM